MLDTAVVVVFALCLAGLGFSAKLRDNTILQYLAAGRQLSLAAFVATLVSTWYGGILAISESVSYFGIGTWTLLGLPYYVFGVIYAFWLAPRVREGAQISIPERLELRFGKSVAILGALLLFLLAVPAAHVLMLGVLVKTITGLELAPAVVIAAVVGTLFLWRGGLLADVRVAMLAFFMMYAGFAVIDIWCLSHKPPSEAFAAMKSTPLWTWDGGQGPLAVLTFFMLGAWTLVDPGFHQRVASAASPDLGRKGILISIAFWMLFDVLSITAALYAVVFIPGLVQHQDSYQRLAAFPHLGQAVLPPGLRALFFCGILGTIVSAMVGYGLISGATVGREIMSRIVPNASEEKVRLWTRVGVAFAFFVAIVVGLQIKSVVSLWYSWAGAVVGAMLLPMLASYGHASSLRASDRTVFIATLASSGVAFGWLVYCIATNNPFQTVHFLGAEFSLGTLLPGFLVSGSILGSAQILAIIRKRP